MALIHINHTGVLVWTFEGAGIAGTAAITCGFQCDNTDVQEIADKANLAARNGVLNMMSAQVALTKVKASVMLSDEIEVAESFASLPFAGAGPAGVMPANCAILVQKRTAFAGKKNRGRFYVPGIPSASVTATADPNALNASALSGAQAMANLFYEGLASTDGGDSIHPVILHPTPSTTVTAVDSFSVQGRLATQRGRLRD